MKETFNVVRGSDDSAFVSGARVLLGLFILITGVMKFFVPEFRGLFMDQLSAAGIPLTRLSLFFIPTLEAVVGAMLLGGVMIRLASLVTIRRPLGSSDELGYLHPHSSVSRRAHPRVVLHGSPLHRQTPARTLQRMTHRWPST